MHPELAAIVALWESDRAIDGAHRELAEHAERVKKAEGDLRASRENLLRLRERLVEFQVYERDTSGKLSTYVDRRDKTRLLIDRGQVSDYQVAQRQYEECAAIVDKLETLELGFLERIEEVEKEISGSENTTRQAELMWETAKEREEAARPGLEAEIARRAPERKAHAAPLHRDVLAWYADLRKKGRDVVTHYAEGLCLSCRIEVSPQVALDVAKSKRVHICRGCGRWLLPPDEDAPAGGATGAGATGAGATGER